MASKRNAQRATCNASGRAQTLDGCVVLTTQGSLRQHLVTCSRQHPAGGNVAMWILLGRIHLLLRVLEQTIGTEEDGTTRDSLEKGAAQPALPPKRRAPTLKGC